MNIKEKKEMYYIIYFGEFIAKFDKIEDAIKYVEEIDYMNNAKIIKGKEIDYES